MREDLAPSVIKGVTPETETFCFSKERWEKKKVSLPEEISLTLYVNGEELLTIKCSPTKVNCLILGFLYNEDIITDLKEVLSMRICEDESLADVRLSKDFKMPEKRTLTSGCGGGISFRSQGRKVNSDFFLLPRDVFFLMKELQNHLELYRISGGVHTSALCDRDRFLIVAEDVGRHNTIDKIQGEAMLRGIPTKDRILVTTGRISSEMLIKAAKMEVPIVISRHTPTSQAVFLSQDLGIAIVGQVRGGNLTVYTHPERLGFRKD